MTPKRGSLKCCQRWSEGIRTKECYVLCLIIGFEEQEVHFRRSKGGQYKVLLCDLSSYRFWRTGLHITQRVHL